MTDQEAIRHLERLRAALPLLSHAEGVIALERAIRALMPSPNTPLTLEELREMDGEPVWVKDFFESHGSWMLVCPDYCENHWGVELYCDYGETWLAYCRRLEEAEQCP